MSMSSFVNSLMMAAIFLGTLCALVPLTDAQERSMPGEILVKFKSDVSQEEVKSILMLYRASVIEHIEAINVYRLKIPSDSDMQEMLELFKKHPRCQYAEPNYLGQGGDFLPKDTFFPQQWHLHNVGQTGGTVDADIDAVEGWQITRGSSAIVVAVLDTGIEADHPEFQGRIVPGFDFVNNDNDPEADHPHGVVVSGILAANTDNSFSVAGIDHHVKILPVKVLNAQNAGTTSDLANGLIFAANQGAHVINMSLINYPTTSATLNAALQFARDAGTILLACAGNGGIGDADVSGPGASPLTISVGATDHNDARANFSGTGQALDMVAPGLNVPTVRFNSALDQFSLFSGCSAATPVVSGITTLLLSLHPFLTHEAVRNILIQTAEDLVGPPTEDTPGRDNFFGHGRVNMHNALLFLSDFGACDPTTPGAILGTPGDDILVGTPGPDVIIGLDGNDIILGLGGDDCIAGGAGKDQIFGGTGNDTMDGGFDADLIFGGAGTDLCNSGEVVFQCEL